MTILDDVEMAAESVPVVLTLVQSITKIVNAKEDKEAQLDALMTAAEAIKKRQDEIKFPDEAKLGIIEGYSPDR